MRYLLPTRFNSTLDFKLNLECNKPTLLRVRASWDWKCVVSLTGGQGLSAAVVVVVVVVLHAKDGWNTSSGAQALRQVGGPRAIGMHTVLRRHVVVLQATIPVGHLLNNRQTQDNENNLLDSLMTWFIFYIKKYQCVKMVENTPLRQRKVGGFHQC